MLLRDWTGPGYRFMRARNKFVPVERWDELEDRDVRKEMLEDTVEDRKLSCRRRKSWAEWEYIRTTLR
jgi:hypothetical protein